MVTPHRVGVPMVSMMVIGLTEDRHGEDTMDSSSWNA
jgi:hypothetical protein